MVIGELATAALLSNDATNVYQLPDGTFEMYSVALVQVEKDDPRYAPQDNLKGYMRVIDRYTSADGLTWGNRKRVITPDADDPIDQQFYYLSVTYTDQGRLGLLGSYSLDAQAIDIEPCYSDDGITWHLLNKADNKLTHGTAYHWDTLVIAVGVAVNSLLGLPW